MTQSSPSSLTQAMSHSINQASELTSEKLSHFRAQFVNNPGLIHLNNAGQSPTCIPSRNELIHWAGKMADEGAHVFPALFHAFSEARTELARFLNCPAQEVVFSQGTASAISQIALGLEFNKDDEIIVWDQEYPSNFYPWMVAAERSGAKLVIAKSGVDLSTPLDTLAELITPRTKVIATSWIQYRSGAMIDLVELNQLARPRGIFTCVDIIQGAGCLPFDFTQSGIDAVCGASHKWMCASHSPGFFVLREEHFPKLRPLMVGAMSYGTPDDIPNLKTPLKLNSPQRYEPGGLPFIETIALGAAARLIRETGLLTVSQEAEWLTRKLMHGLRELGYTIHNPHGAHFRGTIVNFSPSNHAPFQSTAEIESKLNSVPISTTSTPTNSLGRRVSFALRQPGIRLSVHAHNTSEDIDDVLKQLSRI